MKTQIYVITIKPFDCPQDSIYIPLVAGAAQMKTEFPTNYVLDNTGENISSQNDSYSEFTANYWVWKNASCDWVGINHYRRYFIKGGWFSYYFSIINHAVFQKHLLDEETLRRLAEEGYNCVLPRKQYRLFHTMRQEFEAYHSKDILTDTENIISQQKPEYLNTFHQLMESTENYLKCICILPKPLFDEYSQWIFDIFHSLERLGYGKEFRIFAFLGERLMNVWFEYQKSAGRLKIKEMFYVNTEFPLKTALKNDTEFILPKWMRKPLRLLRTAQRKIRRRA